MIVNGTLFITSSMFFYQCNYHCNLDNETDKQHNISLYSPLRIIHYTSLYIIQNYTVHSNVAWNIRYPNWWNIMLFISLIVQVAMIVTLEKRNVIYSQEQRNMPVVIKKVPFTTILATAIITATLKIYFVSIMIHLIKHYWVSTQSKVTQSNRLPSWLE